MKKNIKPTTQKNKKNKPTSKLSIPKTVQKTIPYKAIYRNGIIEDYDGKFSKSYFLEDVNFTIAAQNEQEVIFERFGEFLNMFSHDVKFQINIFNRNVDKDKFYDNVLLKHKRDGLDEYRDEMNHIMISKINEGRNNLMKEKYLTATIEAEDIESATGVFARLDTEISLAIKRINQADTFPMTIEERLNILYDIYNPFADIPFSAKERIDEENVDFFSVDMLQKYGLTSKDVIGPSAITFNADHFICDDVYGRVLFLDTLPAYLSTNLLSEITEMSCGMLTSIHYAPIQQDKAVRLLKNQMVNINANIIDQQKKAARSGYYSGGGLLSPDLMKSQEEASKLIEDMTSRNQKMYYVTVTVALFAESLDDLNKQTKTLISNAGKYLVSFKKLQYQQEPGLTTVLPLACNKIYAERMLTTETASLFIPFTAQELAHKNGMYYGLNAVSHNLILYNRTNANNANGVILGMPGSGKSFAAKREMLNVALATEADVFIIDPEREYAAMAELLGGEVVRIAPGSTTHINPFDMDVNYADNDDPITLKSDFISSLCETIIGGRYGLSPIQKSVIDRCVRQVYIPYMEFMNTQPSAVTCDYEHAPTLKEFYNALLEQPEMEAQNLALALEIYCEGSLDTFAYHTNVDVTKRFVVYDIKDIGSGMKELGLQVCLNDIWNKTIANKKKNKRTWFYIDEFYLLTQTASSARFLQQIYKRARKWGGVPTGITQNVEDLLSSKEARGIINNCDFIMMLNQSPLDGQELARMLNISATQMSYITNASAGQGLLYTGKSIVPFLDKYPTNTKTFKVMTTKMDDLNVK